MQFGQSDWGRDLRRTSSDMFVTQISHIDTYCMSRSEQVPPCLAPQLSTPAGDELLHNVAVRVRATGSCTSPMSPSMEMYGESI